LNNRKKDIRKLINAIENCIIEFLKIFKIRSNKDKKNIGIWVKEKKIAAIGLRVSRWVAFHGFSINVSNNLKEYLKIIPCGLNNKKITSIYLEKKITPRNYEKKLVDIIINNLNKI
jgi:lipoyl(octanoyl) transferase